MRAALVIHNGSHQAALFRCVHQHIQRVASDCHAIHFMAAPISLCLAASYLTNGHMLLNEDPGPARPCQIKNGISRHGTISLRRRFRCRFGGVLHYCGFLITAPKGNFVLRYLINTNRGSIFTQHFETISQKMSPKN